MAKITKKEPSPFGWNSQNRTVPDWLRDNGDTAVGIGPKYLCAGFCQDFEGFFVRMTVRIIKAAGYDRYARFDAFNKVRSIGVLGRTVMR